MPPSPRHGINSWLGVGLFCSITLWVSIFYTLEAHKITQDNFASDFKIYYTVEASEN
jgi:hypothetical protein